VPADPKAYATKTEPHERGAILVAAMFDAYFTTYLRRVNDLSCLYRTTTTSADMPASLARQLAAEASRTAQEFFTLCARSLDRCPPVDITFGSFLRALITTHREEQPRDADNVRDALMNAFRLRGILPTGAQFYSDDAICWPPEEPGRLPPVKGLLFGDPNGLTRAEKNQNAKILRRYAQANRVRLGFDPTLAVDVPSFHPTFRVGASCCTG
ncbi:MAG: peptidase M4, partial [Kiritimatiellaeota bacterium]|nr:peptidase M4 [Kiritimatiellota bacterium]